MVTWNGAAPPALAPLRLPQKARGAARLLGLGVVTLLLPGPYLLGRFLHKRVWRGVTFHRTWVRLWARLVLTLIGVRLRVSGAPLKRGGMLVVNHASWADIPGILACAPVVFVSKAEVRDWPGVGWLATIADTVFIERRRSATGRHQNDLIAPLRDGALLCLFPEGTSTDGRRVLPFKSSMLSAPLDTKVRDLIEVQPATLNWIAPEGAPPTFYGWWGDMGVGSHVWDVLCRSAGGALEVKFHPSRPVTDFADRKDLARSCEAAVRAGLRARAPRLADIDENLPGQIGQ
jgi:1-acyl-sn-glycerol-3-phosphate acyltransferase